MIERERLKQRVWRKKVGHGVNRRTLTNDSARTDEKGGETSHLSPHVAWVLYKAHKLGASVAKMNRSPFLPPVLFSSNPVVMLIGPFN